jgi:hypothetical protein
MYMVEDGKLHATMAGGVMVGKGASKDKPRVPVRNAEAGIDNPSDSGSLIDHMESTSP